MRLRHKAFFGGFAGFTFERTLTSLATYQVRAEAVLAGWNQTEPLLIRLIVPSGVTISGGLPAAINFVGAFPANSVAYLTVESGGLVRGSGGYGGIGGAADGNGGAGAGTSGGWGGTAIYARMPLIISNLGQIAGGGGGGGGGAGAYTSGSGGNPSAFALGGDGGGGAGEPVSSPGATAFYGAAGGSGYTSNPPGGAVAVSGYGGSGGNLGQAGAAGGNTSNSWGGAGGLAGAYIDGAAYVTWLNTGTLLGRSI